MATRCSNQVLFCLLLSLSISACSFDAPLLWSRNACRTDADCMSGNICRCEICVPSGLENEACEVGSDVYIWPDGFDPLSGDSNGDETAGPEGEDIPGERDQATTPDRVDEQGEVQVCDDHNPCTVDEMSAGACYHHPISCQGDDNPCTDHRCNPDDGRCVAVFVDGACQQNDNPCTVHRCQEGTNSCQEENDDGRLCGNGNPCDGAEVCQNGQCLPGTPVTCPECTACNPQSGGCECDYSCNQERCNQVDDDCDGLVDEGGVCESTTIAIDFDHSPSGRELQSSVNVENMYVTEGVVFYTDRPDSSVSTDSWPLNSQSGENSCGTRDDNWPNTHWRGDVNIVLIQPSSNGSIHSPKYVATYAQFYVGDTFSNGLRVLAFDRNEQVVYESTIHFNTLVRVQPTAPMYRIRIEQLRDPDFVIDDLLVSDVHP